MPIFFRNPMIDITVRRKCTDVRVSDHVLEKVVIQAGEGVCGEEVDGKA